MALQFVREMGIVTDLKALHAVRLEAVSPPDARHRGLGDTHLPRHGARGPVGGIPRCALSGLFDQLGSGDRWRAASPRRIFQKAVDAMLDETASPQRDHAGSNIQSLCDLLVLKPFGGKQDNATAQHHASRCRAPARPLLQLPPDVFTQNDGLRHTHIEVSSS